MEIKKYILRSSLEIFLILISLILFRDTFVGSWVAPLAKLGAGPTLLPRLTLVILLLFSTILLVIPGKRKEDFEKYFLKPAEIFTFTIFVISSIALIHAIWEMGLIIPISIYLCCWIYYLGFRPLYKVVIIALVGAFVTLMLFRIAGVYFPKGVFL
ncbi:MAG: hypothetical protein ACFFCW_12920 [Candidatus Hodarchaeota archaeon]